MSLDDRITRGRMAGRRRQSPRPTYNASEVAMQNEDTTVEVWRPVPGYGGRYDVSSHGRVRTWIQRCSKERRKVPSVMKTCRGSRYGHRAVSLYVGRNTYQKWAVHRMVLWAFVGPCPPGMECAHLNGVHDDNRVENLTWATPKENGEHMVAHGTSLRGGKNPSSRLTEEAVREIRRDRTSTVSEMSRRYGVSRRAIRFARDGVTWGHVS